MPSGAVRRWIADRGFGFIKSDEDGADVFVHIRDVQASGLDEPSEGNRLEYELEPDKRSGKMRAARLKVAG